MNNLLKNRYFNFINLVFFFAGVVVMVLFQKYQADLTKSATERKVEKITQIITPTPTQTWIPYPTVTEILLNTGNSSQVRISPSGKFTIVETEKIQADKTSAQTGETVNFTVTIKNVGTVKKFLTHLCFNYSGNVTFGCALNINIFPGDSFNINNSMMFKTPGNYSVWITWSQDGANFYSPVNGFFAKIKID